MRVFFNFCLISQIIVKTHLCLLPIAHISESTSCLVQRQVGQFVGQGHSDLCHVIAVFGCADIVHVPNAVVRRHGNTVVVKCNYSGQTYLLTCSDSQWKGDLANCSKGEMCYNYKLHCLYV